MLQRPDRQELINAQGQPVYAVDGDQVGSIETVYFDDATGEPEWLGLMAEGRRVLVPAVGVQVQNDGGHTLRVPYPTVKMRDAPEVDPRQITEETRHRLYRHYGLQPDRPTEDVQERTREQASEFSQQARKQTREGIQRARQVIGQGSRKAGGARGYLYAHPFQAVAGMLIAGLVLGRALAPALPGQAAERRSARGRNKQKRQQQQRKGIMSLLRRETKAGARQATQQSQREAADRMDRVAQMARERAVGLGMLTAGLLIRRMLR